MRYWTVLVLGAGLLGAQSAPRTVVFTFRTIGVDEATATSATEFFRGELGSTGRFSVVDVGEIKQTLGSDRAVEGVAEAAAEAKKLDAIKAVIGTMSALGAQTVIEVKLIDVAGATVEFSDRLGTNAQSDFDVILTRLARGLAERKKFSATAEVGTVTKKETEEPGRRASFWSGGARIGVFAPLGGFGNQPGLPMGGSGVALYETPHFMAEASYAFYGLNAPTGIWTAGFSGFGLLSKTDICPYYGGGISLGMTAGDFSAGLGPILNLGGGVLFLRTYDFRLVADLRYYLAFMNVATSHGTQATLQHGPAFSFGLYYKQSKDRSRNTCCLF